MSFKKSFLVFLTAVSMPALAWGDGNLHIGQLEIHPFVSAQETYSDNIYYSASDKQHDYLTTTIPGLRVQLPFRAHQLQLNYNAVLTRYDKYHTENTTDHNTNALLDFKFGSLLGLKLKDAYTKNHEPRAFSSTGLIERYEANTATASAIYQLAEISKVQIDYTKSTWNFKTSEFRDREEDMIGGFIYYRFFPKTSAFLEYDHRYINYNIISQDLNNDVDSMFLGLTWEIAERSIGTIKGGYLWKDFDLSSKKDYQTWMASIDLRHKFSDYTSILLIGQREVSEPKLPGTRYIVSTGAYAELTHNLGAKLSANIHGSYGRDTFSDDARKDQTATGGCGLKYLIKDWLKVAIDYNRRYRNSNIDINDYKENAYTFTTKLEL